LEAIPDTAAVATAPSGIHRDGSVPRWLARKMLYDSWLF
jgi:hypothetical protein